jgi:glycosyltransferase involved in cell wall biosynthesis
MNFTLITATYNSAATIEETLKSVLGQNVNFGIKWVFQDNFSKDDTIKIINKYTPLLSKQGISVAIYQEKDKGIGDAWNKALKKVEDGIIGILNSDDTYSEGLLNGVFNFFNSHNKLEILYGICIRVYKNNTTKTIGRNLFPLFYFWNFGFSHTTCFMLKSIYDKIGYFDTTYKIGIDYDFLVRAVKQGVKFTKGNYIVFMKDGGISTTLTNDAESEINQVLINNGHREWIVKLFSLLRTLYKRLH